MDRSSKFVLFAFSASLMLYGIERSLPTIEAKHNLDLNGDGKPEMITEMGYAFFPRYEVYVQKDEGTYVRDNSFSRKEIISKLEKK